MPGRKRADLVFAGTELIVRSAKLIDGTTPIDEYFDGLTIPTQGRFRVLFAMMANCGKIRQSENWHLLEGNVSCDEGKKSVDFNVSEFKASDGPGRRIFAVRDRHEVVLTHGADKPKTRSRYDVEVARAERIFCEDRIRKQDEDSRGDAT